MKRGIDVAKKIAGKTIDTWLTELPLLGNILDTQEVFWTNHQFDFCDHRVISKELGLQDIEEAEARLQRFAPYLVKVFPETRKDGGLIESELKDIPHMQQVLSDECRTTIVGRMLLKCDSHLPISGSVKARGGIYEVLKVAEDIALADGELSRDDDYSVLDEDRFKKLFAGHTIVVGSTGNLGLSIGIMSAQLGFRVIVHMSVDAKQWKKDLLRQKGAIVVEHDSDYGLAVAAGREEAKKDKNSYFVDDENSRDLFLGYAVAAKRLQGQLRDKGILVDEEHPLFVYLPCGIGGAPGGITFGLRTIFGDNVHCFFAEPTHAPAMLLGLMTGLHSKVSAQDFGIDTHTAADGLAVGRPSGFIGELLEHDISGCFTVQDDRMYRLLKLLADTEKIYLEPSALAGFMGPVWLLQAVMGWTYLLDLRLTDKMPQATHIVWATGGGMVPEEVMRDFYKKGEAANPDMRLRTL